eukprot:3710527-Prymnesium_polylepis.3
MPLVALGAGWRAAKDFLLLSLEERCRSTQKNEARALVVLQVGLTEGGSCVGGARHEVFGRWVGQDMKCLEAAGRRLPASDVGPRSCTTGQGTARVPTLAHHRPRPRACVLEYHPFDINFVLGVLGTIGHVVT